MYFIDNMKGCVILRNIDFKENVLYINNKKIEFDVPIKQVVLYDGIYIVLINPEKKDLSSFLNVYGISKEGERLWRIKRIENNINAYKKIEIESNCLVLYDIDFFKHVVDSKNGDVIKSKIRPLDSVIDKKDIKTDKNHSYKNLFVMTMLLASLLIISNISKDYKIKKLTKNNKEVETADTYTYGDLSNDAEVYNIGNNNELYLIENLDIQEEPEMSIFSPDIDNDKESNNENEVEVVNKSEKDKYEGINKTVKVIDTVVDAVTKGEKVSIDDVNKDGNYMVGNFIEVIDGEHIKISINNESQIVKLISVEENGLTKECLEKILSDDDILYIEQDIKQKSGDVLLGYVWVSEPDMDNKKNMLNHYLLKNKYAKFKIEPPNIKYNRFFNQQ